MDFLPIWSVEKKSQTPKKLSSKVENSRFVMLATLKIVQKYRFANPAESPSASAATHPAKIFVLFRSADQPVKIRARLRKLFVE